MCVFGYMRVHARVRAGLSGQHAQCARGSWPLHFEPPATCNFEVYSSVWKTSEVSQDRSTDLSRFPPAMDPDVCTCHVERTRVCLHIRTAELE